MLKEKPLHIFSLKNALCLLEQTKSASISVSSVILDIGISFPLPLKQLAIYLYQENK